MQDTDILALLWERSEHAIDALTERFGNRLKLTAMNILENAEDAEEAVNDTYLALWNAIPPERPEPLAGYVYRTGRNIALKKLRFQSAQKRRVQYTVSLDKLTSILPGSTLEDTLDARILGRTINQFLSTLSITNRRIFLRRYWFGDSIQDLAQQERLTVNALTARLSRLRSQLKDYYTRRGSFMSSEKLQEALSYISDTYIAQAASGKHKKRPYWITLTAAALAFVILVTIPLSPQSAKAQGLIAAPVYPQMAPYPTSTHGHDYSNSNYAAWRISQAEQYNQPEGYANSLAPYFAQIIPKFLSATEEENAACSPLSIYIALAMLAETTRGDTQAQILKLLGTDNLDALRTQAGYVWNAHYCADGATSSLLASSLWLDRKLSYKPETVSNLANLYYASVFQGDLGSDRTNKELQSWLNDQTGGLLTDQSQKIQQNAASVLSLATTVLFRAKWADSYKFQEKNNTDGVFHAPGKDIACTFMNRTLSHGPYFYGSDYSAVYLELEDESRMWFILPDEGESPQSVLLSEEAMDMILQGKNRQAADVKVNLSLPKFDIASDSNIADTLKDLGIADVFNPVSADFSGILSEGNAYLEEVDHAVRVAIDEEGVTAAAYTSMNFCGSTMPPEYEVDFILDRPFLFVITSRDGLPLFAGTVYEP